MPPDDLPPSLAALLADTQGLRALARRLTGDPSRADDLLQEGWRVALERPPREAMRIGAWFRRVMTNLARMQRRGESARERREHARAREEWGDPDESPVEVVVRAEAQRRLVAHVLALEEPYRSTVLWRFFDGISSAAIARRAGVPESTVRTRLARGLAELRQRLEREQGSSWATLLLPLAARSSRAPVRSSALPMALSMKLGMGAGALLLLASLWWGLGRGPAGPRAQDGAPQLASLPGVEPASSLRDPEPLPARGPFPSGTSNEDELAPHELGGRVTTRTGEPLADVEVRVLEPLARQWPRVLEERDELEELERLVGAVRTDAEGRFRLEVPVERVLDLEVRAEGFATERRPGLYGGEWQVLSLARSAALSGRVTRAPDGAPVAGRRVELRPGVLGIPGRPVHSTRTDAEGRYRLSGLAPGYHSLAVERLPEAVVLTEGENSLLDRLLPRTAVISGHVTDGPNGAPLVGARVALDCAEGSAVTDAEGAYRLEGVPFDQPEGLLVASAPGYGCFERRLGEVASGGDVRDLFLLPGRRARGRVLDAGGAPIEGAHVTAASLGRADGMRRRDARSTRTDSEGRFELTDLRIDLRHTLLVRAEGWASGAFDFPAREWEGTELDLGDISLEPWGLVSGRVTDLEGAPLPDLWVQAALEPAARDRLGPLENGQGYLEGLGDAPIEARTDGQGRFVLAGLPSGTCALWAGAKGWARGGELALVLAPGERRAGIVLAFDPGLSIEGRVVDPEGAPVPGASVDVTRSGGFGRVTYDLSREDGSFRLRALEPGLYRLDVAPDLVLGSRRTALTARQLDGVAAGTKGLRLVLPSVRRLRVHVVDRNGDSLPGAWVGILGADETVPLEGADRDGRIELDVPEGETFDLRVYANRHFDRDALFTDSFFKDEEGRLLPDTTVTLRGVVAGAEELVVTVPGQP